MITFVYDGFSSPMSNVEVWLIASVIVAVVVAFYVLRSVALFTMAKRANVDKAVLAWIPCLWLYIACKLIGNAKMFGKTFSQLAVVFCVIFSVAQVLTVVSQALIYFPLVGNFLMGRNIYVLSFTEAADANLYVQTEQLTSTLMSGVYGGRDFVNPYGEGIYSVANVLNVISLISMLTDILNIIVIVSVYINIFKVYRPQHYMLFGILSIFGVFGPLAFAVRKREPINYMDYVRSRYNYNPYGNPYGGGYGNPYNNGYGQARPTPPSTPFEEFAEKGEVDPGDPFAEFENKKDE